MTNGGVRGATVMAHEAKGHDCSAACVTHFCYLPDETDRQCECVRLWDASQCVSYALLSPTRYKS